MKSYEILQLIQHNRRRATYKPDLSLTAGDMPSLSANDNKSHWIVFVDWLLLPLFFSYCLMCAIFWRLLRKAVKQQQSLAREHNERARVLVWELTLFFLPPSSLHSPSIHSHSRYLLVDIPSLCLHTHQWPETVANAAANEITVTLGSSRYGGDNMKINSDAPHSSVGISCLELQHVQHHTTLGCNESNNEKLRNAKCSDSFYHISATRRWVVDKYSRQFNNMSHESVERTQTENGAEMLRVKKVIILRQWTSYYCNLRIASTIKNIFK